MLREVHTNVIVITLWNSWSQLRRCFSHFLAALGKPRLHLPPLPAQWYSITLRTSIASLGTWSKIWLVEQSVEHTCLFVVTDLQVCVHEPDQRMTFPHEGIVKHVITVSVVNWPSLSIYRSCFTFLLFSVLAEHSYAPVLLSDWSLTLTFYLLSSLSCPFFQEKQDPSSTSLQLRTEIQVGRDTVCTKPKLCGVSSTQFLAKKSIWHLSPSFYPQESLGFSSEVSTPETDRKYVFPLYHCYMWLEPAWNHEICLD